MLKPIFLTNRNGPMRMLTKDLDQFKKLRDKPQLLYSVCRWTLLEKKKTCEHKKQKQKKKEKQIFNSTFAWMLRYKSDYLAHVYDLKKKKKTSTVFHPFRKTTSGSFFMQTRRSISRGTNHLKTVNQLSVVVVVRLLVAQLLSILHLQSEEGGHCKTLA